MLAHAIVFVSDAVVSQYQTAEFNDKDVTSVIIAPIDGRSWLGRLI